MNKRPMPPVASPKQAARSGSHADQLKQILDHCSSAKSLAERVNNRFLVYLLDMASEEARTALPHSGAGVAIAPISAPDA